MPPAPPSALAQQRTVSALGCLGELQSKSAPHLLSLSLRRFASRSVLRSSRSFRRRLHSLPSVCVNSERGINEQAISHSIPKLPQHNTHNGMFPCPQINAAAHNRPSYPRSRQCRCRPETGWRLSGFHTFAISATHLPALVRVCASAVTPPGRRVRRTIDLWDGGT